MANADYRSSADQECNSLMRACAGSRDRSSAHFQVWHLIHPGACVTPKLSHANRKVTLPKD